MGVMVLKKIGLLFLLISACFLSTSFAGRVSKFVEKPATEVGATKQAMGKTRKPLHQDEVSDVVHERLLRMNKNDYGKYDPAPALAKPPFKLIPN